MDRWPENIDRSNPERRNYGWLLTSFYEGDETAFHEVPVEIAASEVMSDLYFEKYLEHIERHKR